MEPAAPLRARFGRLVRRLGAAEPADTLYTELAAAWAAPGRVYHTTEHLVDCLARLDEAPPGRAHDVVEAALWFHDAIYDPRAADNEARSAAWAHDALRALGIPAAVADEIARLVLVTRHDLPPSDAAGALVADVDLSVLGRPPQEYDAFERRIREEYAWVPEPVFRAERARLLATFLARRPLFHTPAFVERFERQARDNLARTVARLAPR